MIGGWGLNPISRRALVVLRIDSARKVKTGLLPVLAAEDEQTDGYLLRLAFERAGVGHPLVIVRDGVEAVDYLSGEAPYADRTVHPLPALLLLDLKMPRMTGFDVLAWLTTRSEFKDLPAIVLSSSSHESDIQKARELGACDYIVKPHRFVEYVKVIQDLRDRWLIAEARQMGAPMAFPEPRSGHLACSPVQDPPHFDDSFIQPVVHCVRNRFESNR